jgi:hypothetical protein
MAKNTKNTRPRRTNIDTGNPRSYSELIKGERRGTDVAVKVTTPEVAPVSAKPATSVGSDDVNWGVEYAQVFSDLRQLLVISTALIILMVVLGFVV